VKCSFVHPLSRILSWFICISQNTYSPDPLQLNGSVYTTYINPLKTGVLLNNAQKFTSYVAGNTLHLRYKDQPVNAVKEKGRGLLRELYEAHKYTLWEEYRVLMC
jgi:hypothetical protein